MNLYPHETRGLPSGPGRARGRERRVIQFP
jgi:hypothetical protein